jgi:hypothetical protein
MSIYSDPDFKLNSVDGPAPGPSPNGFERKKKLFRRAICHAIGFEFKHFRRVICHAIGFEFKNILIRKRI